MIVVYVNTKGGVGKSTGVLYTAAAMRARGRTVAVDTDPDASVQNWVAEAAANGEDLGHTVVGLVSGVEPGIRRIQRDVGAEHVAVDTPPGLGDREITRAALRVADVGVIPLSPRMMDANRLKATIELMSQATEINPRLRAYVLLNQVRTGTTMSKLVREFLDAREWPLLPRVRLLEEYHLAFGHRIDDLGDWGPVTDVLLDGA